MLHATKITGCPARGAMQLLTARRIGSDLIRIIPFRMIQPHHDETSTMISHRHVAVSAVLIGSLLPLLTSCDKVFDSPPAPSVTGTVANFSKKPHGLVATRVMVDKAGVATIEFR